MGDEVSKPPSEEGIVPTIQNVVSTLNLGCKIDLRSLVLNGTPNAEYCPRRFPGVVMRIKNPRTTALIFSSGKMVCTGAKSEHQSKLAASKFYRIIKKQLGKLPAAVKFNDFKIRNIVASCDVQFPIRLDLLARSADGAFSNYDPELFPALSYRMRSPMIVVSIFKSGKIVLTGAKVTHDVYTAFHNIYPILAQYRKTNP